jgi:hypothetical protein
MSSHLIDHSYHHSFGLGNWNFIPLINHQILCCIIFDLSRSCISMPFHISYVSNFEICSSINNDCSQLVSGGFESPKVFPWVIFYALAEMVSDSVVVLFPTTGLR